jgi:regulator of replication initiation timing
VLMSTSLSAEEKKRVLKALEEDEEFRYAVAGLIGISEILKRLDRLEANQEKLWLEVKGLRENQEKLWEGQEKLWLEVKSLREGQEKLWLEVKNLREGQEKIWFELRDLRVNVERLTLTVEDEGRDVIRHRLRSELNVDVPLDRVWVDGREVNIYGAVGELCVVGEATVRLGVKLLDELEEKIASIKERRPDLLRPKLIKVVYADYAIPLALDEARARGIWVLKWSGDLTPRAIHTLCELLLD